MFVQAFVAEATVESLYHAVDLGLTRLDQAMLDAKQDTRAIEGVLARWLLALASESVGELTAVVGD
jgi:hypothetical protein